MKKILVATDGSDHAKKAVELASDFAVKHHATLFLVHVVQEPKVPEWMIHYAQHEAIPESPEYVHLEMAGKQIMEASEKVAKGIGVKQIRSTLLVGDPAEEIIAFAKQSDIDMIVMGRRGSGKLEELLLGGVSHKVSRLANCTCVTVK